MSDPLINKMPEPSQPRVNLALFVWQKMSEVVAEHIKQKKDIHHLHLAIYNEILRLKEEEGSHE